MPLFCPLWGKSRAVTLNLILTKIDRATSFCSYNNARRKQTPSRSACTMRPLLQIEFGEASDTDTGSTTPRGYHDLQTTTENALSRGRLELRGRESPTLSRETVSSLGTPQPTQRTRSPSPSPPPPASSSGMSSSSGTPESWISSFCSLLGHEYFAEISEDFIEDDFNLTGLQTQVAMYKEALEVTSLFYTAWRLANAFSR